MMTPEDKLWLDQMRVKAMADTATEEELRAAYRLMRETRVTSAAVSAKSRVAPAAPTDTSGLLRELDDL